MWCGACQQDVPGVVASSSDPSFCCPRCGKPLSCAGWQPGQARTSPPQSREWAQILAVQRHAGPSEERPEFIELADGVDFEEGVGFEDFIELEDWEFEETIQDVERLVRSVTRSSELGFAPQQYRRTGRAPQQRSASSSHRSSEQDSPANSALGQPVPTQTATSLPWVVLAIGMGVFVCGAALIGLSLVNQRPELWQLGVPLVLGGQVAVLAVVIWQLDMAWHSHRATFVALHALDDQLRRLREDWNRPSEVEDEPTFDRHVAAGAGPDVLLADLKRQIDMLSLHLARDKRAA